MIDQGSGCYLHIVNPEEEWLAKPGRERSIKNATRDAPADADAAPKATDASTDEATESNSDVHGDAVIQVAKGDAMVAHENGEKNVNHGGAVSAVAQKH